MMKSNGFYFTMVILTIAISMLANYVYFKSKRLVYTCSSELSLSYPDGNNIFASFNGFIYSDGSGLSTYRGTISGNNKEYILNSDMPFKMHGDSLKVITYDKTIKKNNDTTPDNILFKEMINKNSTYYLSFYESPEGDVIVKDRGSVTYICSH
ncbi:hypothetical protein [Serratia fonticola]